MEIRQPIETSEIIFDFLNYTEKRISLLQGGARSGKTRNTIIYFVTKLLSEKNKTLDIVRATLPALKATVLQDVIEVMQQLNIYDEKLHNKTEGKIKVGSSEICYYSIDDNQKIRGRKRDYLFVNEANEIDYNIWVQLLLRTTGQIVCDYNPSINDDHYLLSDVKQREDCQFLITTYKDNPFLPDTLKHEIERLQTTDGNLWKIYGLGQVATIKGLVFPNFAIVNQMPDNAYFYGQDFGYTNDPTTLIRCLIQGENLFIDECIYQRGLLNSDIARLFEANGLRKGYDEIFADAAEPKSIDELYSYGWNIKAAPKGQDSILAGIQRVNQYKLHVTERSINIIKELKNYKYIEDKNGILTAKPIDSFNHAMDAIRYAVMSKLTVDNNYIFINKQTRKNR